MDRHRSTHGVTFSGAGPSVLEVTGNGGVSDATGDTGGTEILVRAAAGTHIKAGEHLHVMVLIGNVRMEGQLMTSVERKVLGFIAGSLVGSIVPLERGQGAGEEGFFSVGVGIHIDFTTIVQRSLVAVLAQELIFQLETGLNRVGRLMVPRFICNGDGVTVVHHVAEEVGRKTAVGINLTSGTCCGRHDVVFAGIVVHSVLVVILLTSDCHVRHGVVGTTEDVRIVVLVVLRVSQSEVRGELDAVRHIVVQSQASGQTVERLFDDGTGFVVISTGDAELRFFTTTGNGETVVVGLSELSDFLHPVSVFVVVSEVSLVVVKIHDFDDA